MAGQLGHSVNVSNIQRTDKIHQLYSVLTYKTHVYLQPNNNKKKYMQCSFVQIEYLNALRYSTTN